MLGICYENGMGIGWDEVEAYHFYEKASALGCAEAHHNLAVFYEHGRGGKQYYIYIMSIRLSNNITDSLRLQFLCLTKGHRFSVLV